MSDTTNQDQNLISDDELSLKDLKEFLAIFKGALKPVLIAIIIPIVILGFIGYLAGKTAPKEYEAKCVLITDQVASSAGGSLSALATLAGLNVPAGGNDALGADLYPMVLANKPFLIELSTVPIYLKDKKKTVTLDQYFQKKLKTDVISSFKDGLLHLPTTVSGWFSHNKSEDSLNNVPLPLSNTEKDSLAKLFFSNEVYVSELTMEDKKMIGILSSRIKLVQSGKIITLSVKMPEAVLTAEATKVVLNLLIKYITKFKTGKQLENLKFLEARTAESYQKYITTKQNVASFKDNNFHVVFQSVQSKELELQNEYTLAFSLYNQFVSQLEQARIELKKETPLFTVVEPVYIPAETASDATASVISFATTGFLVGLFFALYVLGRIFYIAKIKKKLQHKLSS
jgi:hypothetical protein